MTEKRFMMVVRTFIVDHGKVLVVQREPLARSDPYRWEVPGGQCEEGEEIADTLTHEIGEETHLAIQPVGTRVHCERDILRGGRYDGMTRMTFFGISIVVGGQLRLSHEHEDSRWCRYPEFLRLDLTEATRRAAHALREPLKAAGVYGIPSFNETALIA